MNEALVLAAVTIRDKFGHFNAGAKPAEEKKDDKKPVAASTAWRPAACMLESARPLRQADKVS